MVTHDQELLAQLAAQVAAGVIARCTGAPAQPPTEFIVTTSMGIAKALLEEAKRA